MIQKNNRKAMQQVIKQLQQWVDGEVPFTTVPGNNYLIDVNKVLQQVSTADLVQELSERSDVAYVDADANTTIAIKFFSKHTKDFIVVKNLKGKKIPNHFEVAKLHRAVHVKLVRKRQ
ncbi:hypothetical protein D3C79_803240 [compost metagenome]